MNKKKDGFILLYSVVLIAVVSILIGTIVSLAAGTSINNDRLADRFERRAAIDQIGEYFIAEPTADLTADGSSAAAEINALAEKYGFTAETAQDGDIYTLTLKQNDAVLLIVKVTVQGENKTYEWSYKAADAGEQGAA